MGYLLLLLAQCMVGVCIVCSKALLTNLSPISILTIRFIIAGALLIFLHTLFSKEKFAILKTVRRTDWIFIFLQALCAGALFNILLLWGLQHTSASAAGIVTSALPALVAIFSILFLKERMTFFTALCVVFAVLGLFMINISSVHSHEKHSISGDMLILLALIPEAAYYILAKLHQNKLPVFLISALMNIINIPIFLLWAGLYFEQISIPNTLSQYLLLLAVGTGSALFYVFWFLGCKNIQGTKAGLTTAFMPIATLVIAYLFLNEKITLLQLLGMVLVIISIAFNVLQKTKTAAPIQIID